MDSVLIPFFLVLFYCLVNKTGVIWAVDRNSDYTVALLVNEMLSLAFFAKIIITISIFL